MKNGVIVEDHRIVAMDLKNIVSKRYNVVDIISNSDEARQCKAADIHFLIMDTDIKGSFTELKNIYSILHCDEARIVLLTSLPLSLLHPTFEYSEIVFKPFQNTVMLEAIEKCLRNSKPFI